MENPDIISRIRSLADESDNKSVSAASEPDQKDERKKQSDTGDTRESVSVTNTYSNHRRRELLTALKPYVKSERAKAIDTMLTVIDVIGVMKER